MLFAFVGPPCSGKTTTAARLFADLKEQGLPAEFLVEHARSYIASKRFFEKDTFSGLDDQDQFNILQEQAKHEDVLALDPRSIVVADSSPISALLYMTDEFIAREAERRPPYGHPNAIEQAQACAARYDAVFRCSPVRPGLNYDPNRVHSYEQSVELEKRIDYVFGLVGMDRSKVYPLFGDTRFRVSEASSVALRLYVASLAKAK